MVEAPAAHLGAQRRKLRIKMRLTELRKNRLGRQQLARVVGQSLITVENPNALGISFEERDFEAAVSLHPHMLFLHLGIKMKGRMKLAWGHGSLQPGQAAYQLVVEAIGLHTQAHTCRFQPYRAQRPRLARSGP